jgi:hypothetical protein
MLPDPISDTVAMAFVSLSSSLPLVREGQLRLGRARERGRPKTLKVDNGPEFAGRMDTSKHLAVDALS